MKSDDMYALRMAADPNSDELLIKALIVCDKPITIAIFRHMLAYAFRRAGRRKTIRIIHSMLLSEERNNLVDTFQETPKTKRDGEVIDRE